MLQYQSSRKWVIQFFAKENSAAIYGGLYFEVLLANFYLQWEGASLNGPLVWRVIQPKTLLWKRGVDAYQYMCLEYGLEAEDFRCTDGNSHVRRSVFDLIAAKLCRMCIDCLVVEKPKTDPALREEKRFYPEMLCHLLKFVLPKELAAGAKEVIVITDTLPVNKKRRAVEKGVWLVLAKQLSRRMKYRILHQASRSHYGLIVSESARPQGCSVSQLSII